MEESAMGFVRGGEHTSDSAAAAPRQRAGSGVVILAPKQTKEQIEAHARPSNIVGIRRVLQQRTARGRAVSLDVPRQRRASPTYDAFKPRGSPSYEPLQKRGSPTYEPMPKTAEQTAPEAGNHPDAAGVSKQSRSRSRSSSGRRSGSKRKSSSRSRSRSRKRHKHSRSSRRHSSSRSRSRSHGRHKHKRSRSRSRHSRHRSSRKYSRSRNRDSRHTHSSRYSRSRSRSRSRDKLRPRNRSPPPLHFSKQERDRARAEEAAYNSNIRRGKQGLGFGQNPGSMHNSLPRQQQAEAERSSSRQHRDSKAASKGVAALDPAEHIPGYALMSAAEKLKARMRLVMAKAEAQSAAAEEHSGLGPRALGSSSAGGVTTAAAKEEGWTRFVFDRHGALDEDKQARQQVMDNEVAAGYGVGDVGGDVEGSSVAFVMGTGRAAAKKATALQAAEQQHDDAIFGRPFGGTVDTAQPEIQQRVKQLEDDDDSSRLAASLGVSHNVLAGQQQMSWRERAMAMKARKQQP